MRDYIRYVQHAALPTNLMTGSPTIEWPPFSPALKSKDHFALDDLIHRTKFIFVNFSTEDVEKPKLDFEAVTRTLLRAQAVEGPRETLNQRVNFVLKIHF